MILLPSNLRITLARRRAGSEWRCNRCGLVYLLERRAVEHTGISYWRWAHPAENEETRDEAAERTTAVFSHAEQAYPVDGRDDGGYQYTPAPQIGFRRNEQP